MRHTLADKICNAIVKKYPRAKKFESAIRFDEPLRPYVLEALQEKLAPYNIEAEYNQILVGDKLKKDRYAILIGRDLT